MDERNPSLEPLEPRRLPVGKKEILFAAAALLCGLLLCNFTLYGGFGLGFAIAAGLCLVCSTVYLWISGRRPTLYSGSILILCLIIAAGFARTDDGFVKFVMVCFLLVGGSLSLSLTARRNRYAPGGVRTLLDAPIALFQMGVGQSPEACRGLSVAFQRSGELGKKSSAVLLGLAIAVPLLAILIPLLVSADAAFDGLLKLLPKFDFGEFLGTVIFGVMVAWVIFVEAVALRHGQEPVRTGSKARKGLTSLTLNIVLGAVCLVYVAYLLSQLAYFVGGFSGILPEEYTMAQYARRGFFEMAWLCVINLTVITVSVGISSKTDPVPLSTRLLCLFIGIVSIFFVATASGKMFLYIGSYGLTRLRVLTQVIMLFLALTTALVCLWLFAAKLPYMKAVILSALVIGAAVIWTDVDTQVANYNVDAYLSGKLETMDVEYLSSLGDGAVPAIWRLSQEADSEVVVSKAKEALDSREHRKAKDFRCWNYVNQVAAAYLPEQNVEAAEQAESFMAPEEFYYTYLTNTDLEAFSVAQGYVCLRGWEYGSDKVIYCLAKADGSMFPPVWSQSALTDLCRERGLDFGAFDNWIPLIESEFCAGDRFTGIRGRSIEADVTLWYILDTEANTTHGPFRTEDEYWQACYDLKAYPIGDWEPTKE